MRADLPRVSRTGRTSPVLKVLTRHRASQFPLLTSAKVEGILFLLQMRVGLFGDLFSEGHQCWSDDSVCACSNGGGAVVSNSPLIIPRLFQAIEGGAYMPSRT